MHMVLRVIVLLAIVAVATTVPAEGQKAETAYEMRVYTASPGRLTALQTALRDSGTILGRHGATRVFAGTVVQGAAADGPRAADMLIEILQHSGGRTPSTAWAAIESDPEWRRLWSALDQDQPILAGPAVSTALTLTDFSPSPGSPAGGPTEAPRVFELRHYRTGAAGLANIEDRLRVGMAKIIAESGMTPIAYWAATDRTSLVYLVAHRDAEAAAASWRAFMTPYRAFMTEYASRPTAVPAAPRSPEDNRMLAPTSYSPVR